MPRVGEQLETPLEGGDQLDAVAERNPRVRIERDRRRRQPVSRSRPATPRHDRGGPRRTCRSQPPAAAARPATACARSSSLVTGSHADGERPRPRSRAPRLPPRRGTGRSRCGVAPQCPPSASAIERTYVPEPTGRSSRATPPSYPSSVSSWMRIARSGISTATPGGAGGRHAARRSSPRRLPEAGARRCRGSRRVPSRARRARVPRARPAPLPPGRRSSSARADRSTSR